MIFTPFGVGAGAQRQIPPQRRQHLHCRLAEPQNLKVESPELVRQALALHAGQAADFSDYLLAARAQAAGYSPVLTIDKNAAKSVTHELLR